MRALCDVNALFALAVPTHQHYPVAAAWLSKRTEASIVICRMSQNGLLRLLTQKAIVGDYARTMSEAWQVYDTLMADTRFLFVSEPSGVEDLWRRLCPPSVIAPHLWTDAYLAAFAAADGMQLVTFDKGFKRFAGVDVLILGQQPAVHEEQAGYQLGV